MSTVYRFFKEQGSERESALARAGGLMLASRRKRSLLWRGLQITVIGLIFALLLRNLYSSWNQISAYDWSLNYPTFAIAFFLMLLASSFYAYLWKLILVRLGNPLSYRKSFRIFFLSQLGRYLPGKIWGILGLVYLSEREGIPKSLSAASITLQLILQLLSGTMVFLFTLPLWPRGIASLRGGLYPFLILLPLGLLLIHPSIMRRGLDLFSRLTKQEVISIEWNHKEILAQLALWTLFWSLNGLAHLLLINALVPFPLTYLPIVTGIFAAGWVVGFVALFAPAGLGVMEGTLTFLLSFYFPAYVAIIIALLTRLVHTSGDLLCAAVAWRL